MEASYSWLLYGLTAGGAIFLLSCLRGWFYTFTAQRTSPEAFVSLLVIVHNQEETIEAFLRWVLAARRHALDHELVVVDAASNDETWPILSRLAKRHPGVRLLRWRGGLTEPSPLAAGFVVCRSRVVVVVELTRPEDVPAARVALESLLRGAGRTRFQPRPSLPGVKGHTAS